MAETTWWQCTLYDEIFDYPYADTHVYATREDAERRAERLTYLENGSIHHWASVHSVNAHPRNETERVAQLEGLVRDMHAFMKEACGKYPRLFDQPASGGQTVRNNLLTEFDLRIAELGLGDCDGVDD